MNHYQSPYRFTISQIRSAATCPRIFYFDQEYTRRQNLSSPHVTRVWESNSCESIVVAAGALFHNSIEKFNRLAAQSQEFIATLESVENATELHQHLLRFYNSKCLNRQKLIEKPAETIEAFTICVHRYMQELADIVIYARSQGHPPALIHDQIFGDKRKLVDVTFHVGPEQEAVHIVGRLDYVFYDWRVNNHRIIDYKLTPSDHPNNDLFQVVAYALMHQHQHRTHPDVAVFYLHPQRNIVELPWEEVEQQRHQLYDLLASMIEWIRYEQDKAQGLFPPGETLYCSGCRWNTHGHCESELGPKENGQRFLGWSHQAETGTNDEPKIEVREPGPTNEDSAIPPTDSEANPKPAVATPSLLIGHVAGEFVSLDPCILNAHVAVVGAAGSGKTWLAKCIAEESVRSGVPVLAIDPQGDLVQFVQQISKDELPPELHPMYEQFVDRVETRIYTPGSSHATRISLSPLRLPTEKDLEQIERQDRREEEMENMLSTTAGNLVGLADIGGEVDSQRTLIYKILQSYSKSPETNIEFKDVVSALMAPESLGIEDSDMILKKSEREKLARKLFNFIEGPAASLFRGGIRLNLDQLLKPTNPEKVPLNIIYLNALTSDDEKQFFVAMLAAEIYRWMVTSLQSEGDPNLLFYLDEARDFIPAGSKLPPAKNPLIRLFTQGRKYGVGCLLCTQSPRSVDYNVFGNCSTKVIGRMEAAQDIKRVGEWFSTEGPIPAWVKKRKGAEPGTFVARWPGMPTDLEGRTFHSRMLYSLHVGAWSPDRVEVEVHPLE